MSDTFRSYSVGLSDVAVQHVAITPSDSEDIDPRPRAIRANGAGDVVVRDETGTDVTYTVAAGEVLPIRAVRVLDAGTTATGIVGWL